MIEVSIEKRYKPFIKWAGGKSQLLDQFEEKFPIELKLGKIKNYVEPFLGGGAVFFHIVKNYFIDKAILFDINEELILLYQVIKKEPYYLIELIEKYKKDFLLLDKNAQANYYYKIRDIYNSRKNNISYEKYSDIWIERAAQFLFLNKTCFNGLYRVNAKGEFNVPFGKYKNPQFYDRDNILEISKVLQNVELYTSDFDRAIGFASDDTFVYLDPPYRPISKTANFTSYSKNDFTEEDQIRLSKVFKILDQKGARVMLSNSDPQNVNPDDNFFEEYYDGYNIHRIKACRMINSNGNKRGKINELLITNY